jgi:hypothetical protein
MTARQAFVGGLVGLYLLAGGSRGWAIPIELKDTNDTKYFINSDVDPGTNTSNASGAVTNATYTKPVTVTSTFIAFTPWFGFTTIYTVQFQINEPLTPAFDGFNGLLITGYNGETLAQPLVYNPSMPLASQECEQGGENRQLVFEPQAFASHDLTLQRKVFVPNNDAYARWLNIITNTGSAAAEVDVSLKGKLASASETKVTATSTGDSSVGIQDTWFSTAQIPPLEGHSTQPKIGYVVQGAGATSPATSLGINGEGQTAATYHVTIAPGASAIILTFVTVQGQTKQAKNKASNLVTLPSKAVTCLTEQELAQIVNFAPITPPVTTKATIKLNFKKTGEDTVSWKGDVELGAGINLTGVPVTVDLAGVTTSFLLNSKGKANNGDGNSFSIDAKLQDGVTKADNVKFHFKLKGDYQTALAAYGWTNADADDVAVTAPITITAGQGQFTTNQPFTYNAKAGKSGTGKFKQGS